MIEEANWLTLPNDIKKPGEGFDAIICLGNSLCLLPGASGDLSSTKTALNNFCEMLKPGGVLIVDHRNYDHILDSGKAPGKNIYYQV